MLKVMQYKVLKEKASVRFLKWWMEMAETQTCFTFMDDALSWLLFPDCVAWLLWSTRTSQGQGDQMKQQNDRGLRATEDKEEQKESLQSSLFKSPLAQHIESLE